MKTWFWTACLLTAALAGCATDDSARRAAIDRSVVVDQPPAPVEAGVVPPAMGTETAAPSKDAAEAGDAAVAEAAVKAAARAKIDAALERLRAGNATFVTSPNFAPRRAELTAGQHPIAAIVCCSDSRVPPEHIFGQGLGDLFIVRVAGNVVSPEVLGSVEYAVEHLHVPLVVVLGHESCGAVKATVDGGEAPGSIGSLVERIAPSVKQARALGLTDPAAVLNCAIDLNIDAMAGLIKRSPLVAHALAAGETRVLAARYTLASGAVNWRE